MHLDDIDKKLLNAMQLEFPLSREPFSVLGTKLGINADEVLRRIEKFKQEGVLRLIGPVMEPRKLGYQTTLVAMKVAEDRLDRASKAVNQHPGISHGYERAHNFNLWFTLALPPGVRVETELKKLSAVIKPEAMLELPALKLFKIGVFFDLVGDGRQTMNVSSASSDIIYKEVDLSPADKLVANELQQDVLLAQRPFDAISDRLGMDIDEFLSHCRSLQQRGIIRRFGASIKHNNVGFSANVMACWIAPPGVVEMAGKKAAALREVSHCYERKTSPLWAHNLFAMIHGHTRDDCRMSADKISEQTGLSKYILLFSVKEIKKTRIKYLL